MLWICLKIQSANMSVYIDDLPFLEIADILKISQNNVKIRLHRGREKLKNYYPEYCK